MNIDGSAQTRITNNAVVDGEPHWSPDGTKIAFTSTREGLPNGIYVMNADGSGTQERLSGTDYSDFNPDWSPDGTKIAFRREGVPLESVRIYVMPAEGGTAQALSPNGYSSATPEWSPDGSQIAFMSHEAGRPNIHTMNADGSNVQQVTFTDLNAMSDLTPTWSPDGTQIAFTSTRHGGLNASVYRTCATGTEDRPVVRLTLNVSYFTSWPDWSPTGTTPSLEGCPAWPANGGAVRIEFDQPIPALPTYEACTADVRDNDDPESRILCSVHAYNQYRTQLGGNMTWGQFISLVMYSEGHPILLGQPSGGTVIYSNPEISGLGICWRFEDSTESWLSGSGNCNVLVEGTKLRGIQNDFTYAVWEWFFNQCALFTGFVDANGNVDYEKDGLQYSGECNERGFVEFLAQVQSLYQDTSFNKDPNLYLARAQEEFVQWGWHGGQAIRYRYGICPCTWGNVRYETPEAATQAGADPEYSARRNDNRLSIHNGNSYSYFAWDPADAPDPDYRYFKVY